MAQTETDKEIAEVVGMVAGVAFAAWLWKAKVRPWLDSTWAALGKGESFTIGSTSWDSTDLVGLGALVLVAVVGYIAVRRRMRRAKARREMRKREREREREQERGA